MILSPTNATAIAPRAWDTTAAKRRQAERFSSVEHIVTKIIAGLEKNIRHGCTDEGVTRIVHEWAGPLAKYVVVGGLSKPDRSRMKPSPTRRGSPQSAPTLRLQITHSAVIMELRGRLPALKAALKPTGITEVRL
jgi:hypothetical protein